MAGFEAIAVPAKTHAVAVLICYCSTVQEFSLQSIALVLRNLGKAMFREVMIGWPMGRQQCQSVA
jgi:hypothetical protein